MPSPTTPRPLPSLPNSATLCAPERLLELIHDFVVFDAGTKKICRHNQYFGVRAARKYRPPPRRRDHLAHPGQREEPHDGVAGEVDPRTQGS